jgi:tetratricopeptide (TPR) repeat protein
MQAPNEPPSTPTPPPVIEPEQTPPGPEKNFLKPVSDVLARLPRDRAQGFFWLIVLATSTLTGAIAFQWLTGLPSTPNCRKIFQATLSDSGQLYCADQAARKGDEASLSSALKLAGSIDRNDPLFEQSRQLADHWSKSILVLARRKVEAGNLKKGIELAQQVPTTSPVHAEAQAMINDWQGNWKQGEEIFQKAKKAIQDQDWGQATEQVRDLVQIGSDYWQKRADSIVAEIAIEQQAFLKISEAQTLVDSGNTDNIAKAIQTVSQIDPQRLARKRMAEKIDEWSQKLIDIAKSAQANGNYEEAMKAAQKVPPNAKGAKDAAAYLQIGRAETLENKDSLWSSIQAYAYSAQIDSTTPAYETSREKRRKWEGQVQNWGQLAIAHWFADIDQVSGYRTAIDQAKMVAPNQPRRVEAQTLIASWSKQIETFSDRQFLARAKQMAVDNTVASLQMAIAEAGKALSGELQNTAQALVAEWGNAVERVEDKPILDQARTLAQKGDLSGAIGIAEKIGSERALYGEARDEIYTWTGRIQAVEDRPILSEAEALANEGHLSEAIARASDIGSNRAMYGEAQSRIGDWVAQRRQIEDANRPQPAPQEAAPTQPESPASGEQAAPPPETSQSGTVDNSAPPSDSSGQESAPPPEPSPAAGSGDQGGSNPNF